MGLSLLRRAPPALTVPLAATSLGDVVLVGVDDALAVVAMEEGVTGAIELSEAGELVEIAGGAAVPLGLPTG